MDYIDFTPIVEADSSGSECSNVFTGNGQISMEEIIDQPETSLSTLLRQDSVKSRYEFTRQESNGKKKPVLDSFPNIRGLDYETSKSAKTETIKNVRRSSNIIKSSYVDALSLESMIESFPSNKIEDDLMSSVSEASEKMYSRANSRRSKTFNVSENIDNLNALINNKTMSPEMMLVSAIGHFFELEPQNKKKDLYLIELASGHLEKVSEKCSQRLLYKETLVKDIGKLERFLEQGKKETLQIEEEIKEISKQHSENRANYENKFKQTHHKVYLAVNQQEKLNHSLKETMEKYFNVQTGLLALEERWKMTNEDLYTQLYFTTKSRIEFELKMWTLQESVNEIQKIRLENKVLKKKIKICTKSLCEVTNYINEDNIKSNFSNEFCGLLENIRKEIISSIETEKEFMVHAITDPKSIMPYYRASNPDYRYYN